MPKHTTKKALTFNEATLRQHSNMRTRFAPKYNLANELTKPGRELPFTLAQYRGWVYNLMQSPRGMRCSYCDMNLTAQAMSPDHVLPVKRGGGLGFENLAPACQDCNIRKGGLDGPEYRALLAWMDENLPKEGKSYIMQCLKSAAMGARLRFFPREGKAKQPRANLKVKKSDPNATLFIEGEF